MMGAKVEGGICHYCTVPVIMWVRQGFDYKDTPSASEAQRGVERHRDRQREKERDGHDCALTSIKSY